MYLLVVLLSLFLSVPAYAEYMNSNVTIEGTLNTCVDAGSSDTYACSISPALKAYHTGSCYTFKANTANTGAASLNLNSLGAKTIKKVAGGITTDLADNDIRAGQVSDVCYDGTNMQLMSLLGNAPSTYTPSGTASTLTSFGPAGNTLIDAVVGTVKLSGATEKRIPFIGTGGLVSESANLNFYFNNTVEVGDGSTEFVDYTHNQVYGYNSSTSNPGLLIDGDQEAGGNASVGLRLKGEVYNVPDLGGAETAIFLEARAGGSTVSSHLAGHYRTDDTTAHTRWAFFTRNSTDDFERLRLTSQGTTGIASPNVSSTIVTAGQVEMQGGPLLLSSASSYLNFGSTPGTSGYGIRDNAGTIECKNSAGSWSACQDGGAGSPGGSTTQMQYNSSSSFAGAAAMTYTVANAGTLSGVNASTLLAIAGQVEIQNGPLWLVGNQSYYQSTTKTNPSGGFAAHSVEGYYTYTGSQNTSPINRYNLVQVSGTGANTGTIFGDYINPTVSGSVHLGALVGEKIEVGAGATIDDIYGLHVFLTGTSTTNNAWGIYVTDTTGKGSVSAYDIYTEGPVRFGGKVLVPSGVYGAIPVAETIVATATITADACGGVKQISSASAVTTNTTNSITAPAASNAGCVMHLCNVNASNAITLDKNANILLTGGADLALAAGCCVDVISTGASGVWKQTTAQLCSS